MAYKHNVWSNTARARPVRKVCGGFEHDVGPVCGRAGMPQGCRSGSPRWPATRGGDPWAVTVAVGGVRGVRVASGGLGLGLSVLGA